MCNKSSTEFINEKIMFGGDISKADEVRNFSLLWNMFELLMIKERKFPDGINEIKKPANLSDQDRVEEMFLYFKNRYGENGKFDPNHLLLENSCKNRVLSLLNGNSDAFEDRIYVIFHIIRRIRNNFFHGNKEFHELSRSEDLFESINKFLIPYIEKAYNEKYC